MMIKMRKETTMANHRTEISRLLKIHHAIATGKRPTLAYLVELCEVKIQCHWALHRLLSGGED